MAQSIEPNIADLANGWLKSYGLDYRLEQESLNSEIDKALKEYESKGGGKVEIVQTQNMAVSKMMGHKSLDITMKTYAKAYKFIRDKTQRKQMDSFMQDWHQSGTIQCA